MHRRSLRSASRAASASVSDVLPKTPARLSSSLHPIDHTPLTTNSDGRRLRASQTSTGQRYTSSGPDQMPSNATRDEMDPVLLAELAGAVSRNVPGFADAFFPASHDLQELFDWAVDAGVYVRKSSRWKSWPSSPTEGNVLAFFQSVVDNVLLRQLCSNTGARAYPYVPSNTVLIRGGDCRRKTDLLLSTVIPNGPALPTAALPRMNFARMPRTRYDWRSIRVVGELKANPHQSDTDSTLAQLANYVREIFNAQPSRRWVHAFTLCGHHLRAWMFDRSGATTSELIDINAQPVLFLRVVCGYALMDATAVGFDPSIKWLRGGVEEPYDPTVAYSLGSSAATSPPYLYAPVGPLKPVPVKLEIDPNPLFHRRSIVTRGSVCWKARRFNQPGTVSDAWPYVVKDQWRAAERPSECDIISSMQRPDRTPDLGLPEYCWYGDHRENGQPVDIANTVRRGCMVDAVTGPPSSRTRLTSSSSRVPGSMAPPLRPITEASNQQPGHNAQRGSDMPAGSMPPPRWSGSRGTKRRSTAEDPLPESAAKRPRRDAPASCNNRIFSRLVMAPVGRAIDMFTTVTELLEAMRDAICGHRTLYNAHQILHRDVSLFNILIDDDVTRPGKGLLIDLDLAIRRDRLSATGASHRTGTQDFMAPGLLCGNPHSFRHDLESFFYVLLWIATYYTVPPGDGSPTELRSFNLEVDTIFDCCEDVSRNFTYLAMVKSGFVQNPFAFEKRCLAVLDDDMRAALGPLLSAWRDVLYPPGYCVEYAHASPDDEAGLWQTLIDACQVRIEALDGR
ncbi:hypothetical protein FN846DRAFT_907881 [Sphaerosporella brunnea]|uniref:Fungal-type protein kinase domain-containing protein n=1 Tax=Sphaerosporella brunnea TaxID=1250544 RepID=A0A5J5EU73_9PEZI|nr:hypothetical protein FN846DRAFT_907881 [Sphaerosporella brunnea]